MTLAALTGLGSGALHAVAGPDHVLSLAPLSARAGSRSWSLGVRWGLGHALGTLLIAVVALGAVRSVDLALLARWGDVLAGAALITTGALGLRARTVAASSRASGHPGGSAATIGLVHGIAGGAAVVSILPAILPPTWGHSLTFVLAFGVGSTVGMAALTRVLAELGARVRMARTLDRASLAICSASIALGAIWLARAL